MQSGILYIVSTPIGNLEDITYRAVRVLREVQLIAAEDTRRTKILLNEYQIKTPVISYHSYSGAGRGDSLREALKEGKNVALVSDAGTPGISDPGERLIRECINENIPVTVVPGPSALIAGLIISGKPVDGFVFEGFLSNKGAKRKKQLEKLLQEERTVVLYESPHRIEKLLQDFKEIGTEKEIVIAREITKKFEEVLRGKAELLIEHFKTNTPRGEFVVIF
ncbi:MAG TPA: 16S rRNA (cytidine(1402)-2'-O)-methyltransferase [Candidatus Omnitrophota bacterium]|nr:16S rRNA (cytidine(1402)-2'-O)-methyltransferase [Candidatus Omnitrophota bacterium]HPS20577.1 16S rRNA (cytidine(1402)-2'-O)-methyltransferase [Candidatus Omnitrophota bacterium]